MLIKLKYIFVYRVRNAGRSHSLKTDNISFERAEEFKYLGTDLKYQNSIQEEIKSRWNSGNAGCHSVQTLCLPGCYPNI